MREPNFFLVGAPKCGTTALYEMLGEHPDVFVSPVKEPDFLAADLMAAVPRRAKDAVTGDARYRRLFAAAEHERAVGEGSVSYLASLSAPAAIAGRCPDARIIMVLRDPAARLYSHHTAAWAAGATRETFRAWFDAQVRRRVEGAARFSPITAGEYGSHLRRYLAHFPRSHILVIWHEDFVRDAAAALRGVFAFLDVDPQHQVNAALRRNDTRAPRWALPRPVHRAGAAVLSRVMPSEAWDRTRAWFRVPVRRRMPAGDRALAIGVYEDDVAALAALTGRDLSAWLDAAAG